MRTDPELNALVVRSQPKNLEEAKEFLDAHKMAFTNKEAIYWTIAKSDTPKKGISLISLWNFTKDYKTAELGYELHPDFHRKGIMQKCVAEVINYGFKKLGLKTIEAHIHHKNLSLLGLLKKTGFEIMPNRKDTAFPHNIILCLDS